MTKRSLKAITSHGTVNIDVTKHEDGVIDWYGLTDFEEDNREFGGECEPGEDVEDAIFETLGDEYATVIAIYERV